MASLKYLFWVWSYGWYSWLIWVMQLNMLGALIPSILSDLGITITVMGTIIGFRILMGLPSSYLAGYFGDKWGRVAWLRFVTVIFIGGTILLSISWNLWSFIAFSFLAQFISGLYDGLAFVLVAEHSPAKHRGWLVGITNSFAFGAIFGPLLGSWGISSGLG